MILYLTSHLYYDLPQTIHKLILFWPLAFFLLLHTLITKCTETKAHYQSEKASLWKRQQDTSILSPLEDFSLTKKTKKRLSLSGFFFGFYKDLNAY